MPIDEKSADYYNRLFQDQTEYHDHYRKSFYYVHWTQVIRLLELERYTYVME